MRDQIIRLIKKSDYLFFIIKYWRLRFLMCLGKFISDEKYITKQYKMRTRKVLNLENPELYNEKVQDYKLHYHNHILKQLVDKYEVRQFVEEKIGGDYLTKN